MENKKGALKASLGSAVMVASVMFASHAGSGFATGNQADKYFIQNGFIGLFMPILAVFIMAFINRQALTLSNNHKCNSYKEMFEALYHPYDKLEILFEVYFNIMVLVAVGAVIAGAAALLEALNILPYIVTVILVSIVLFFLTVFGADLVAKASSIFSAIILITCFIIFIPGITTVGFSKIIDTAKEMGNPNGIISPIVSAFSYAGFCSVVLASLIDTGKVLKDGRNATRSMVIGFIMNVLPLLISVLMLFGWAPMYNAAGKQTLPTLFIAQQIDNPILTLSYNICLFLCLISTGVTTVYGFVSRFRDAKVLEKKIASPKTRGYVTSLFAIIVSMAVSLAGLDKVINYGYRYMGYFGAIIFIIPLMTVGVYKNYKFKKAEKSE